MPIPRGKLVFVEFDDQQRPTYVLVSRKGRLREYAFNWSRHYGAFLVYSEGWIDAPVEISSGAVYWAHPELETVPGTSSYVDRGETVRLDALPAALLTEAGPKHALFDRAWEMEASPEYCNACRDYYPNDETCDHIFWTENGFAGAGAYRTSDDETRIRASLLALAAGLGPGVRTAMAQSLRDGTFSFRTDTPMLGRQEFGLEIGDTDYGRKLTALLWGDAPSHDGDDIEDDEPLDEGPTSDTPDLLLGAGWLRSLEPGKTDPEIALTITWLEPPEPEPAA